MDSQSSPNRSRSHSGTTCEAATNPPSSVNYPMEPQTGEQDIGKLELGASSPSVDSASHGFAPPSFKMTNEITETSQVSEELLFKGDGPTNIARWSPRYLLARVRRPTLTRKHYTIFAFVMLLLLSIIITLSLVLTLAVHGTPAVHATPALLVDLNYTQYQGAKLSNGITQWLGMRYAAPPLGQLRFKAPQDPPKAPKQQANKHGALCHSTPSTSLDPTTSEDCLFIDVSAPSNATAPLPVFFFIQGGGFNTLSNPNPDPTHVIAAANYSIVVASFNYRVGPWGFLASKEVEAGGNLNVGLLDQRKALQWVQQYIHLFGGDPNHVTIDGDSAGAGSVDLLLTAYGGRDDGLFHAAIGESNSFGAQLTVEESQYQYDGLVNRTGCDKANDTLNCLRELDVAVIAENNINMPTPGGKGGLPVFMYSNIVEGPGGFTENYTYNMYSAGNFIKVPVIFGSVTNEGTIFTPTTTNTLSDMNNFLQNNWVKLTTGQISQIDKYYPQDNTSYPRKGAYWRTAAAAYGELRYNCPGIFLSQMYDSHGDGDSTWQYHWDVLTTANQKSGYGVTHVAELSSIFGTSTGQEAALIPAIQGYWMSFIRSKNPNTYRHPGTPEWTVFGKNETRVHFPNDPAQVGMETVDAGQHDRCQYYSDIGNMIGN